MFERAQELLVRMGKLVLRWIVDLSRNTIIGYIKLRPTGAEQRVQPRGTVS